VGAFVKITATMREALERAAADGAQLVYIRGGFWTTPSCPVSPRGVPHWWVSTHTAHALERRGLLAAVAYSNDGNGAYVTGYRVTEAGRAVLDTAR
jgi:hypothetical protein